MAQRILLRRVLSVHPPRPSCTRTFGSRYLQGSNSRDINGSNAFRYPSCRFATFQATRPLMDEAKEGEDDCPPYQNPLHHNDPDSEKIMLDDFDESKGEQPDIVSLPPLGDGSDKVIASPELHALADEIVNLKMLEVKELVDRVADHFGIEESDDDDVGIGAGEAASVEEVVEEKTAFELKLTGFDAKSKIKVIKEIRAITGLGLKEAKETVEGAPKTVKKDIKMEEAEELKAKLEAVGATVEIE